MLLTLRSWIGRNHWRVLALAVAFYFLTSCAATRTETNSDSNRDRQTVTKTTETLTGTQQGQPTNLTRTVYTEEQSKEVAHAEQSRVVSIPAAQAVGGLLSSITTGNPAIDAVLAIIGAVMTKKGVDHVRKKKEKPNA